MLKKTREAILSEFEETFRTAKMDEYGLMAFTRKDLKKWLTQALNDYTQKIVEMVDEMKEDEWRAPNAIIRNQALDDIKEELQK